jgi:hypothetical protein
MTFETDNDLRIQKKAITLFVSMFDGTFQKLDPLDVDYKVFDSSGSLIAYAEIRVRVRTMTNAYPLPVSARKITKLMDKRISSVVIWACDDGIIYGKPNRLVGQVMWGKKNSPDEELMIYYDKQKEFKYVRFT